ncbi:hypothetical protein [Herbiconiux sp. L3-i23]|uniref:hypothetical protein n=1 Tax=Herbiconiux sp. L3-i23 TaxID=2905871 RepID=UPI0020450C12|nr:hypothetical protein [Herbiconiux sp. L3-i23]BDI23179.1 hypothetical protein L3i23_19550 [Herbiconiux sp. L3-i23]
MNTTLGARSRAVSSIRSRTIVVETSSDRLGVLDRLAMRVGLALLLWGQRDRRRRSPDEVRLLRAAALDAERDRERLRSRLPNFL